MALITKTDIQNELQITLAAGYTDLIIQGIVDWAHSLLMMKTNRTAFSGNAADAAKYAELCLAIDRLSTSNRDLVKAAISSISENGSSITFSNGKTLAIYREEAIEYIKELRIPGTRKQDLTFADPSDEHEGDEKSTLY